MKDYNQIVNAIHNLPEPNDSTHKDRVITIMNAISERLEGNQKKGAQIELIDKLFDMIDKLSNQNTMSWLFNNNRAHHEDS